MSSPNKKNLEFRNSLLVALRQFFALSDYTEVNTPIIVPIPALEDYIDAQAVGAAFLRTSPEFHMKRLLAQGWHKIYQIGPCFRKGEFGNRHRPEFTMLEWYRTGTDYRGILQECQDLLIFLTEKLGVKQDYCKNMQVLSVAQAFELYAPISLTEAIANENFEEILCQFVEPQLGKDGPLYLIDYPASMAALARKKHDDTSLAERWELYMFGVEIANAYSELTDAVEQRERFLKTQQLRQNQGREVYPIDEDFLSALGHLSECGGIALGVERLCMVLLDLDDIGQLMAFS